MYTRKIFTNTLAQIAAKVMTALISIFMIKILTSYLDVPWYGLYSKIYNFLSIFAVVADLGLYTIAVREISENIDDRKKVEKIAANVLSLRTLMGIVIIFLAFAIAFFLPWYKSSLALTGVAITGFFTLFWLMNSSIMSLLQAHLRTEFSFVATVTGKITTFVLIAFIVYLVLPENHTLWNSGLIAIFTAWLVGNIVMTAITWWYARRVVPIRFEWDSAYIRHIVMASLPYWIALFLNVVFFKIDVVLISIIEPHNVADISIALYSVPMKIVEVGMMYGMVFLNSLLPVLTFAIKKDDTPMVRRLTEKSALILLFFALWISAFCMIFAREIITLVANEDYTRSTTWYSSVEAMQIVAPIFLFYFLSSLFTYTLIAANRQKIMLSINGFIAVINALGNIILIPYFSFIGSAVMTLVSQILLLVITAYVTRWNLRIGVILREACIILLFLFLALFLTLFSLPYISDTPFIRIVFGVIIFALVYGVLVGWFILRKHIGSRVWKKLADPSPLPDATSSLDMD